MSKVTLNNVAAGFAATTLINANNDAMEVAIENTLSRDGTGPNMMLSPLDMNGNMILNQANPITVNGFNWEGPWITTTHYQVGDVIQINNSSYIAIVDHIAGVFATDLAASKWQLVASSAALPAQAGHTGDILTTDGSTASWADVDTLALPISGGTLTGGLVGTTASFSGILSAAGVTTLGDNVTIGGTLGVTGVTSFAADVTAPTQVSTDNSTKVATTAYVINRQKFGPIFLALNIGAQSLSTGVLTKIILGSESFDTNSNFSSNRFTPSVAGYYLITGSASLLATNITVALLSVFFGPAGGAAVEYTRGSQINDASGTSNVFGATVSTIVAFNGSTDYVELYTTVTGTTPSVAAGYARFSGMWIRPL